MVASMRMPAPRPVASILMAVEGALDMARNASARISAALLTSRPVRPRPATTASGVEPVAWYSSRMRDRMPCSAGVRFQVQAVRRAARNKQKAMAAVKSRLA